MSSISDAYLQFITASFSVYLLPTLSRLTAKADITREIGKALKFVLPAVAAASLTVWLLRDFAIWLLFPIVSRRCATCLHGNWWAMC